MEERSKIASKEKSIEKATVVKSVRERKKRKYEHDSR